MKSKMYIIGLAIFLVAIVLFVSAKNILAGDNQDSYTTQGKINTPVANNPATGEIASVSGNVQTAKLALKNSQYTLTPNKLRKGVPVRIEVDASTLGGCMKNVVFRDFGITKRISAGDNIIEFTPDKTGVFWITCTMGMGPGSYEVVNNDGTSDPTAQTKVSTPPPQSGGCGGGCGGGGGSCGG